MYLSMCVIVCVIAIRPDVGAYPLDAFDDVDNGVEELNNVYLLVFGKRDKLFPEESGILPENRITIKLSREPAIIRFQFINSHSAQWWLTRRGSVLEYLKNFTSATATLAPSSFFFSGNEVILVKTSDDTDRSLCFTSPAAASFVVIGPLCIAHRLEWLGLTLHRLFSGRKAAVATTGQILFYATADCNILNPDRILENVIIVEISKEGGSERYEPEIAPSTSEKDVYMCGVAVLLERRLAFILDLRKSLGNYQVGTGEKCNNSRDTFLTPVASPLSPWGRNRAPVPDYSLPRMSQDMRRATRDNAEFRVNMRPPRSDLSIDYHLRGGTFRLNTSNRDPLARGPFCEADDVRGLREEDEEENDTKKRSRDAPRFGSTGQSADSQTRWHTYCMSETWIYLLVSLYVALSLKHDCVPAHPPPLDRMNKITLDDISNVVIDRVPYSVSSTNHDVYVTLHEESLHLAPIRGAVEIGRSALLACQAEGNATRCCCTYVGIGTVAAWRCDPVGHRTTLPPPRLQTRRTTRARTRRWGTIPERKRLLKDYYIKK
ncbi:hypothetical protein EAG_01356 [Camponotus floridanus]|uniref:Uncharacterized protein n=1 Tax=Camponotus floridanus TaxID=104421 RepID=E1ZW15_CAMFO|nr:hypothetical protein EAG_01356 [Camponotus floridanus]